MLNLSTNRIEGKIKPTEFRSFGMVKDFHFGKIFTRIILIAFAMMLIILFMPWTQNIRSSGIVTTLQPDQRPQTIHSVIAGKMEKWFVKEGDLVQKGDTILFLSEIKDDYFDPNLLERTEDQIEAKELSVQSYMNKVNALDDQIDALLKTKNLKIKQAQNYLQQARLSVSSDSVDLEAAKTNYQIALKQYERQEELYKEGLKSLTDLETRKLKLQETQAKMISAENKLLNSRNKLINAEMEVNSTQNQYRDKLAKAESDKYTALSSMYDAEAAVTKMQNQYMNYSIRTGLYYITSPIDGYITKAIRTGIGETIKEGEDLVSIMPVKYDLGVEIYVEPFNLPLIQKGQKVRFMFDGWPSIVFSGWPNSSYGTFGGEIVAIDNFISENGKYRILVAPDKNDHPWPQEIRVGSGAVGMALLKDVPVWYELWRNLNGFPPDYYKISDKSEPQKPKKDA
ncbi:MAG: HlyD family efflux transporter periplasmic adaptor subunit [Flavobacteriales bacterium]|nr:HlyD family efflux transporter periplasmic adaptor subunit [Flavobacteriales bacterium]